MAGNVREWQLQMEADLDLEMGKVRTALIETAIYAEGLFQTGSPVDTGQFRANWHVSVGGPDTLKQEGPGPGLAGISASNLAAYPEQGFWPVIVVQNNLPYALKLEEGSSLQAPSGVVAVNVPAIQVHWNGLVL